MENQTNAIVDKTKIIEIFFEKNKLFNVGWNKHVHVAWSYFNVNLLSSIVP